MGEYFKNVDLKTFWVEDDEKPKKLTNKMVEKAEKHLGYKLPLSYIELLKTRNGGTPLNTSFPTTVKTSWADDHIEIDTIYGIGVEDGIDDKEFGSKYLIEEWGYPAIGITICMCPAAGPDAVMLDYSKVGSNGEPSIVHVDIDDEPVVTFLANDFETFVKGLVSASCFDSNEE